MSGPTKAEPLLHSLLASHAAARPEERAYVFLSNGGTRELPTSYIEIARWAQAIAGRLCAQTDPGDRALLICEPGMAFVAGLFGCLMAGVPAVPAYPPDPGKLDRTLSRLLAIVEDCQPAIGLTTTLLHSMTAGLGEQAEPLRRMRWLTVDVVALETDVDETPRSVRPDDVALIQYTSGSTSRPKGVVLSHRHILENQRLIEEAFGTTTPTVVVSWLPQYHDMGLVGMLLHPLYTGGVCIFMSPLDFIFRPAVWLEAMTRYRAQVSGGPNFAYDLCCRKTTEEELEALDLSAWRVAYNGSERVRPDTVERFLDRFGRVGFRPEAYQSVYGLAEASLIVTGGTCPPVAVDIETTAAEARVVEIEERPTPTSRRYVGVGHALGDERVLIVDPELLQECPPGRIGEVWVNGPSVAFGYWNKPEATKLTFKAHLSNGDGPFLRTGDLGFMHAGELYITTRLADMFTLRGRNFFPEDVERHAEKSVSAIRPGCCAVFIVEESQEENRVVVVAELERRFRERRHAVQPIAQNRRQNDERRTTRWLPEHQPVQPATDVEDVRRRVRRAVMVEFELPLHEVVLVVPGSIHKTSSGKIQRHACRRAYQRDELERIQ